MNIIEYTNHNSAEWNSFIKDNYPPIGAFMQTWAWGNFQKDFGRKVRRFQVIDNKKVVAIFTLVEIKLRFSLSYGYIPRGPIIIKSANPKDIAKIFLLVKEWSKNKLSYLIFLRLEPPISYSTEYRQKGFIFPKQYVQPIHNIAVKLTNTEDEILASFHSSTRSNTKRAENRGVTVEIKEKVTQVDYDLFAKMIGDTIDRNNGIDAYPSSTYFGYLLKEIPITAFIGYQNGSPASIHFVVFFGTTATYLYGASHTKYLSSKVDTYLHWTAMKEAKRKGCTYYDLGGIDTVLWPGLTVYKRQFKGDEVEYMGNIDIPFKTVQYRIYMLIKSLKRVIVKIFHRK